MIASVNGGGWITFDSWGKRSDGVPASPPDLRPPTLPKAKDIFNKPMPRYGRFDQYTRLGLGAMTLALLDAGYAMRADKSEPPLNVGIVSQSHSECVQTDHDFYDSTLESDGVFSSPNLFSYTLPGIVQGECAVHFGLGGPSLCLGSDNAPDTLGAQAVIESMRLLRAGKADAMLAGWIEAPHADIGNPEGPFGAAFVVLASDGDGQLLELKSDNTLHFHEQPASSIFDLFV